MIKNTFGTALIDRPKLATTFLIAFQKGQQQCFCHSLKNGINGQLFAHVITDWILQYRVCKKDLKPTWGLEMLVDIITKLVDITT